MEMFARLAKVHEEERVIYARALCEEPDRAGEIVDYATAVDAFKQWSSEMRAASDGKSMGNVRIMHQPRVAGRIIDVSYNDRDRAIDVVIKVDDEQTWQMCKTGAYTGLSIGGGYAKKWTDVERPTLTRYTPRLSELSIVDRPCIASATFQLLKADGTIAEQHFVDAPSIDAELIDELRGRVAAHNEAHSGPHQKTKLGDLKKAWERGAGIPGGGVVERHMRGIRKVDEHLARLSKADAPRKPRTFGDLQKNSDRGNNAGAYAGAAITGGIYGFVGRKLGGVALSPVTATLMAGNKRARKTINRLDDGYAGFKVGVKRAMRSNRPGLIPGAIRHSLSRGRALDAAKPGFKRSVRGVLRVPGVAVGAGLGLYAFNRDLNRRKAKKMDAGALQKRSGVSAALRRAGSTIKPKGRFGGFEAAGLAAATAAGATAGGMAAKRGNPYRDENGKFTSKDKASLVIGVGVTAGAVAGLAGGVALTRYGVQRATKRAYDRLAGFESRATEARAAASSKLAAAKKARNVEDVARSYIGKRIEMFEKAANSASAAADNVNAADAAEWMVRSQSKKTGSAASNIVDDWQDASGAFKSAGKKWTADFEATKSTLSRLVSEEKVLAERGEELSGTARIKLIKLRGDIATKRAQVEGMEASLQEAQVALDAAKPSILKGIDSVSTANKFLADKAKGAGSLDDLMELRRQAMSWEARAARTKSGKISASTINSIKDEELRDFIKSGAHSRLQGIFETTANALKNDPQSRYAKTASALTRDYLQSAKTARSAGRRARAARRSTARFERDKEMLYSSRIMAATARASSPMKAAFSGLAREAKAAARVMGLGVGGKKSPSKGIPGLKSSLDYAKRKVEYAKDKAIGAFDFVYRTRLKREKGEPVKYGHISRTRLGATAAAIATASEYFDPKGVYRPTLPYDTRVDVNRNDKGDIEIVAHYRDPKDQSRRKVLYGQGFPSNINSEPVMMLPGTVWRGGNSGGGGQQKNQQIKVDQGAADKVQKFVSESNNRRDSYFFTPGDGFGAVFRRKQNDPKAQERAVEAGRILQDALIAQIGSAKKDGNLDDGDFFDFTRKAVGSVEFEIKHGDKATKVTGGLLDEGQTVRTLGYILPGGRDISKALKDNNKSEAKRAALKAFEDAPPPPDEESAKALKAAAYTFKRNNVIDAGDYNDILDDIARKMNPEVADTKPPFDDGGDADDQIAALTRKTGKSRDQILDAIRRLNEAGA